jgi:hypothetical protein
MITSRETKRVSSLCLGHAFREKDPCTHSWTMDYWAIGSITKRRLWYGDLGSVLWIVKGLDMNGGGGVALGGHDGRGSKVVRE